MSKEKSDQGLSFDDINLFGDMAGLLSEVDNTAETQEQNEDNDNLSYIFNQEETPAEEIEQEDESNDDSDEDIKDSEDTESDNENTTEYDDSSSLLIPYAKMLVEDGILPSMQIDQFDGTADGLKNAMIGEIQNGINYYKESLPREIADLITSYESGVPFDEILKIKSDQIRFSNITEDQLVGNDDLQKNLLKEYYKKTTMFNDDKINKSIERLFENGELEDEAKFAVSELIQMQSQEEQIARDNAQKEYEAYVQKQNEQLQYAKDYIAKNDEIIPGVKVSALMKDKLVKNLTTPVAYDQYGNPVSKVANYLSKNPIESEILLNYLFEATEGFKNFSVFGKVGKSKAISELEAAAKAVDAKSSGTSNKSTSSKIDADFFSALKNMGL